MYCLSYGNKFICPLELINLHNDFQYYCNKCYDKELKDIFKHYVKNTKKENNYTHIDNMNNKSKKPKNIPQTDKEKNIEDKLYKDIDGNNNSTNFINMNLDDFFKIIENNINPERIKMLEQEQSTIITNNDPPDITNYKFEWIGDNISSIKDLIRIGNEYNPNKQIQTNIDLWRLNKCVPALQELDNMIGMQSVKYSIFYQVIFHLQKLDNHNKDMHHTVIKGPPGVGKTQLTHIIAKIYKALGFLKNDNVISVKRDDMIAGYVGQTAIKTKKKLESALGGVLLIDEAYAFGQGDGKDSFSKEAIDLLTSYLSEHGHEFICIIAGYKDALDKRFFSLNEGLHRRFNIHYEIEGYEPNECMEIFIKLIKDNNWNYNFKSDKVIKFFETNKDNFPNFGGDMLTLFSFCKKAHSKRLLKLKTLDELNNSRKNINYNDLKDGFKLFLEAKCEHKSDNIFNTTFGFYT